MNLFHEFTVHQTTYPLNSSDSTKNNTRFFAICAIFDTCLNRTFSISLATSSTGTEKAPFMISLPRTDDAMFTFYLLYLNCAVVKSIADLIAGAIFARNFARTTVDVAI